MARTTAEIQNEMLAAIASDSILSAVLTSTSLSSIYRNFTYIVAYAISTLEGLFDLLRSEIDTKIYNQKNGRLVWYRTMALAFQYGFSLVTDHDYYDNTGFTDEAVAASKIVKYAAVGESTTESRIILKIAGETDDELAPLSEAQKSAFDAYIKEVKWPGRLTVINYLPDLLNLKLKIKYDGMVLNNQGMSILNANYPINTALAEYMKELPFDGELKLSALVDKLQAVEGVKDVTLINASSSWIDATTNAYAEPVEIDISTIPVSGYFKIQQSEITYYTDVV